MYAWASKNDLIGSVLTLYELHSGDDHQDSGFYGTDPVIVRRAISVLEREGKVLLEFSPLCMTTVVIFHHATVSAVKRTFSRRRRSKVLVKVGNESFYRFF